MTCPHCAATTTNELTKRTQSTPHSSYCRCGPSQRYQDAQRRPSRSQGVHAHPQLLDEPDQSERNKDHDKGDDDPDNTPWSSSHSVLLRHNESAPSIHQRRTRRLVHLRLGRLLLVALHRSAHRVASLAERLFRTAHNAFALTGKLISLAFGLHAPISRRLANTLLHFPFHFVSFAFELVTGSIGHTTPPYALMGPAYTQGKTKTPQPKPGRMDGAGGSGLGDDLVDLRRFQLDTNGLRASDHIPEGSSRLA